MKDYLTARGAIMIDFAKLTHSKWVNDKYEKFYNDNGYIPRYFEVYNGLEIIDIAPSVTTRSNGAMGSGTVLVIEIERKKQWTTNSKQESMLLNTFSRLSDSQGM